MPFSGGVFSIVNTFVPGTTILSASVNANFSDIATGLSDCLTRDNQAGMTAPLRLVDGTVGAPALTFSSETGLGLYRSASGQINVTGGGNAIVGFVTSAPGGTGNSLTTSNNNTTANIINPIGMVVDFAGSTAPGGWLLCFGQSLLRASYPELFAAISTTYGAADGSHFSLPDCRGRVCAGQDNMGGSAANRITVAGGNFDATVLGGTQDTQSLNIAQNQLPNVSPSGSATPTLSGSVTPTLSGSVTPTISGSVAPSGSATPTVTVTYDAAGLNLTNSITPVLNQISGNVVNFTINAGGAPAIQTLNASGAGNSPITPTAANKTLTAASSAVNGSSFSVNGSGFAASAVQGSSFTVSTVNGSSFTSSAVNGSSFSLNGNVSQHLTPVVQPTIIFNKIIFAGR